MDKRELGEIANAKTHIETVDALNKAFISHAAANGTPHNVPAKLNVSGEDLSVPWFSLTCQEPNNTVERDASKSASRPSL
jgi:hypothetical protein